MLVLFPDTNLFLQCRELSQLDWSSLSEQHERVLLLASRSVQDEIDRLKQDGNTRRSKRARRTNSLFRKILLSDEMKLLIKSTKPRVELQFAPPMILAASESLDLTRADDRLIAEALCYRDGNTGESVSLLTHDTNPVLTARHHGLACVLIPDEWLLPPEKDPRDKRLLNLEERVKSLESEKPVIEIRPEEMADGVLRELSFEIVVFPALTKPQITALVEEAKSLHPLITHFHETHPSPPLSTLETLNSEFVAPEDVAIQEYTRKRYPEWVDRVAKFLKGLNRRLEYADRVLSTRIHIANTGSAPGTNVVVEIDCTPCASLLPPSKSDDSWLAKPVTAPSAPSPPKGEWRRKLSQAEQAMSALKFNFKLAHRDRADFTPAFPDLGKLNVREDRDRHGFYWKPDRPSQPSCSWALECDEFRHQVEPEAFEIDLFVEPAEVRPSSGCVSIRVTASNLAAPVSVQLPLSIKYTEGDTMEEARRLLALTADST